MEILQPKTKTLFSQQDPIITFKDIKNNNEIVGQFRIINGVLTFEGNTDKSAKIFIEFICETFNLKQ